MAKESVGQKGRATVLVVDDEVSVHEAVAEFLGAYRTIAAYTGAQAMEILRKHHVDVVLLDLNLPDTTGLAILQAIRAERDSVEVIVLTSHATIPSAVACTKAGAFDYVAKYDSYEHIGAHIERALAERRRKRADLLRTAGDAFGELVDQLERTTSPALRKVLGALAKTATTSLTVLIEGESGVGKEIIAKLVHVRSGRCPAPFVPVNVAAIPPTLLESTLFGHEKGAFTGADRQQQGKFELADGGTLFLDEIGELDLSQQAKLLRVIQEREVERVGAREATPVDVRLIVATHRRLEDEVTAGRFREDLYFRLNVIRVVVPPLRERRADLPELITLLATRAARTLGRAAPTFTKEGVAILKEHSWPGNVRELENLILRLAALHPGETIGPDDIPVEYCLDHFQGLALRHAQERPEPRGLYKLACDQFERYVVRHVVERCHGNKSEAARVLGVSLTTVKTKMNEDGEGRE